MWVRWRGAPSTRRQGYAEEEGRGARDAGGVERRLEQMGVRRSPPSGPHGRLRTFFAVAISDSISSVDRLLASSNLGNAIMRAAAERATSGRVECTHTRSPLALATSASSIKNSCMLRPGERGERRRRPVWPFVVGFRCLLSPWAAPRCQMPTSRQLWALSGNEKGRSSGELWECTSRTTSQVQETFTRFTRFGARQPRSR